jgi:alpha-N-arabinofuranosidase
MKVSRKAIEMAACLSASRQDDADPHTFSWLARTHIVLFICTALILVGCQRRIGLPHEESETMPSVADGRILIDPDRPKAALAPGRLGINMNFLLDDETERRPKRPLQAALKEMGVRSLRFPGGEDSDGYLWSVAPFSSSVPTLARTGTGEWPANDRRFTLPDAATLRDTLDFDEFIAIAKEVGAEPIVVVCYDSMYKEPSDGGNAPERRQLLETAVQWVRYANITKGYGVKYWEIGNESYMESNNGAATPAQYAADLKEFSAAMKAVDPSIQIGANGLGSEWWSVVLSAASSSIDFLSVHVYPVWAWESYDHYRRNGIDFTGPIVETIEAIHAYAPAADKARLRIAVTETNVGDWSPIFAWPNDNDLGHALVAFDLFGQLLSIPEVDMVHLWTTRWITQRSPPDVYDALSLDNDLHAVGRALAIWGQHSHGRLVAAAANEPLRVYAAYAPEGPRLTILILNKAAAVQPVSVSILRPLKIKSLEQWVFRGTGPSDHHPIWERLPDFEWEDPLTFELSPFSITVLSGTHERRQQDIAPAAQSDP